MTANMTSVIRSIVDGYNEILVNRRDPRVDGWLFMDSPWPTMAICLSYVYTVKVIGPRLMKNRPPIEMRNFLVFYNFAQVIFSAWLFYEYGRGGWFHGYSFVCQPVDYSNSDMAIRMVHACWWYYFSKFTEFFDTFFFTMRKKFQHVSHLHVIHHGIMPMSVWFGVKFTPGGHSTFFGLLNTFVHVVMYLYYMMAAMGPRYHKYLWWKRYLTTFQMVQFVCIITHAFQLLFVECNYPRGFVWWIGGHALLFLVLFLDFYRKAYYRRPKKIDTGKKTANGTNGKIHEATKIANGTIRHRTSAAGMSNGSTISNGTTTNGDANGGLHQNGHVVNGGSSNGVVTNGHLGGSLD